MTFYFFGAVAHVFWNIGRGRREGIYFWNEGKEGGKGRGPKPKNQTSPVSTGDWKLASKLDERCQTNGRSRIQRKAMSRESSRLNKGMSMTGPAHYRVVGDATACLYRVRIAWCSYFMLFQTSIYMPSVLWRCWLGGRKGIRPVKTEWWGAGMVICLQRGADLRVAQLMPLPLTVSCFSKFQIGFTFLVPAHPGSPGKRAAADR